MKYNYGNCRGHAAHPTQSPWAKRKRKIIFPRIVFCKSRDSWTQFTTYHVWIHHRWGSSFLRIVK